MFFFQLFNLITSVHSFSCSLKMCEFLNIFQRQNIAVESSRRDTHTYVASSLESNATQFIFIYFGLISGRGRGESFGVTSLLLNSERRV